MIIHGHVYCDLCECHMGQRLGEFVSHVLIANHQAKPHFAVCPDCSSSLSSEEVQTLGGRPNLTL